MFRVRRGRGGARLVRADESPAAGPVWEFGAEVSGVEDVEFGCVYASDIICAYRMEAEY